MLLQCKNIPSHFSHFHSQMILALSSIMILITSSQLELKHPLCKKLQHSLNCSISQMEFPPHHLNPLWKMRALLINPTFIRSGQSSIPCGRDIVEPYTIPIITTPHSSISQWSGIHSCSTLIDPHVCCRHLVTLLCIILTDLL